MKRMLRFFMPTSVMAFAIVGCNVGPDYHAPHAALPSGWDAHRADAKIATTAPAHLSDWWTTLNDPELNKLIVCAVAQNPDILMAAARVTEARAQRGSAVSNQAPNVDTKGSYSRERFSPNMLKGLGLTTPRSEFDDYQAGFDASWELDLWGRLRRGVEAADANLSASVEGQRDVLVRLLAEVARNYVELRTTQRRLAIAQDTLAAQRDTLRIVRIRREAGVVGELDVARAEEQVRSTEAIAPALQGDIDAFFYSLGVLLGQSPDALVDELTPPRQVPVASESVVAVGLPSDLLRRRPDIRQAERELASANARIGIATADYFPRVSLTGAFVMDASHFAQITSANSRSFNVGPTVTWNIFDFGRVKNAVAAADARRQQAAFRYQQVVLESMQEVETAISRYTTERQRRQSLAGAVDAGTRAVDLAKVQYAEGSIDLLEVLDTQRSLYAAQDALAVSDQTVTTQLVALYKSLGGGWETANPQAHPVTLAARQ